MRGFWSGSGPIGILRDLQEYLVGLKVQNFYMAIGTAWDLEVGREHSDLSGYRLEGRLDPLGLSPEVARQ